MFNKEVLTVAFDIMRKEAGAFKNIVELGEEVLEIFRKNEINLAYINTCDSRAHEMSCNNMSTGI